MEERGRERKREEEKGRNKSQNLEVDDAEGVVGRITGAKTVMGDDHLMGDKRHERSWLFCIVRKININCSKQTCSVLSKLLSSLFSVFFS
jgi:hypothetical protein